MGRGGPGVQYLPAMYYLGTTNKRSSTSQQPLEQFKTKARPPLPLHRLGTNSQLYKRAMHLIVLRTQQMLHTLTPKRSTQLGLAGHVRRLPCLPLLLIIRVHTSVPFLPGAIIHTPHFLLHPPAPTLSLAISIT